VVKKSFGVARLIPLISRFRGFAVSFLIFSSLSVFTTGATKPSEITVDHFERSLQPGELILLRVRTLAPVERVEGQGLRRTIRFFQEANHSTWNGMLGIDLETKPGAYAIKITAVTSDGTARETHLSLDVKDKDFPTRELTVKDAFVNPPRQALARIRREQEAVSRIFGVTSPDRYWSGAFILPVPGAVVSGFGARSILNGQPRRPHGGADLRASEGTPVKAPNSGKVILAEEHYYSGNTVILDHGLGMYSYFAHLSRFAARKGDVVKLGDTVGYVGKTGRVTGPHLHWAVEVNRARVDPLSLIAVTDITKADYHHKDTKSTESDEVRTGSGQSAQHTLTEF
jgi:murein DD-endopeptidase MepM/ murein hydrolase activator NlpD